MTPKPPRFATPLLAWYRRQGRDLPWRRSRDPYRIWVSEAMLQQTQVETVIPYYERFLERFPRVEDLAAASLDDVLKSWENLGYYSRARHLHQAARIVAERFAGRIPDTWEDLTGLPGVGPYTAGAVLSIAYGRSVAAVDGNVRRVLCRFFGISDPPGRPATKRSIDALAASLVPRRTPGLFNQALMDLGATLCTPRNPRCGTCPVGRDCRARQEGRQDSLPAAARRVSLPQRQAVAAVIRDSRRRLLVVQRPQEGLLASLWGFPGGFVDPGEAPAEALRRSIRTGLGVDVQPGEPIAVLNHAYTHFRVTLHAFRGRIEGGRPRGGAWPAWRWATPRDLEALAFSRLDRMLIDHAAKT